MTDYILALQLWPNLYTLTRPSFKLKSSDVQGLPIGIVREIRTAAVVSPEKENKNLT